MPVQDDGFVLESVLIMGELALFSGLTTDFQLIVEQSYHRYLYVMTYCDPLHFSSFTLHFFVSIYLSNSSFGIILACQRSLLKGLHKVDLFEKSSVVYLHLQQTKNTLKNFIYSIFFFVLPRHLGGIHLQVGISVEICPYCATFL